jgi:hypothetical protein
MAMLARCGPRTVLGCLLIAVALVGSAAQAQTDLVGAAKKEGRVVVYGSMETDVFEVI